MKEVTGDIWKLSRNAYMTVTTNGYVNRKGQCVMGRGIALEVAQRWPQVPLELGHLIQMHGNHVYDLGPYHYITRQPDPSYFHHLISFPVKHTWSEPGDLKLIQRSAIELAGLEVFKLNRSRGINLKVYMTRPGCGNGRRTWEEVKPILAPILDDLFIIVERNP
jgi:hypothetical protein